MRNKCQQTPPISVTELQLDPKNFRLGTAENQRECIALLLAEKKSREYLLHLAKDIAFRGLAPKPIIVTIGEDEKYIVRDGNRRIAALKLLNNPSEAPDSYRAAFSAIAQNAETTIISDVECILTDNQTALELMELDHLGFQDGVGQIDWGSNEKDNLMEFKGEKPQNDIARGICTYLNENGIGGTDKVKMTIFQRLFQDQKVREAIGIQWDGNKVEPFLNEKDVLNIISEILLDFTERGYITRKIFTAEDRINYLEELFARGISRPSEKDRTSSGHHPKEGNAGGHEVPAGGTQTARIVHPPVKASWDRARLIPPRSHLPIPFSETKARNIANELSSKIKVKESPNAAAVLLRLFLEFSVDYYIKKHSIVCKNDKLAAKIKVIADNLAAVGHITAKQLEQLEKMKDSNQMLSAHTLNAWIHNPGYSPDPQVLCTFWENIHFFVNHCWTK